MMSSWADAYRDRCVMVLGASGFIGRWVCGALLARGAQLVAVARSESAARRALPGGPAPSIATCVVADLSDEDAVHAAIRQVQPAVVFNLAGYGVDRAERDEGEAVRINAALPRWIVEAVASSGAADWPGARVVHAGSALEYGESRGDLREDSAPRPTTLYGRTKLAGTEALAAACRSSGVPGLTARLFTVYGPGEHAGRLLPTLLEARGSEAPIPLSEGRQARDFTYVEDVAEGLLRLGATPGVQAGAVVNLASGRLTEVREFVRQAATVLGLAPARLAFGALPTRPEEMQHQPVANARLRALTGWVPATPIVEGVRRTVARSPHRFPGGGDDSSG